MTTQEKVIAAKEPVYVIVHTDGREYQGQVYPPKKNGQYPYVSYLTREGFVRREFTWGAIEQAVRLGSWLYA